MAKKKASSNAQVEKKPLQKADTVKPHQQEPTLAMDSEASEKIDNLKSLNQMLLKEAVERRQQIDALAREKGFLEKDLDRSNKEKDAFRSELARLGESFARMDVERGVVADFVAEQMSLKGEDVRGRIDGLESEMAVLKSDIGEKEREIRRLIGKLNEAEEILKSERGVSKRILSEKDEMKYALDLQLEETGRLKVLLSASEGAIREMNKRIAELTNAYSGVVAEKEDLERRIECINSEKSSILKSLEEANMLSEDLREELHTVVHEKEAIEEEKTGEVLKREELENVVSGLHETVASLQKEDGKLRATVALLERQCFEGGKRLDEMSKDIEQLVEAKSSTDKKVEWLLNEKNSIEKQLIEAIKEADEQKLENEQLLSVKNTIESTKVQLESEVLALRNEVAELEAAISKLKECAKVEAGKIKSLESVVVQYRQKLAVVESEKAEMEIRVCKEEKNAAALKGMIAEFENKVNESLDAAGKAKSDNAALLTEKSALESEHKVLTEKLASLEHALTEARNEVDSIKSRAQMANARSKCVMNMLKDTVAFCAKDENNVENGNPVGDADEQVSDEYATEFEMIRSTFRSKTSKVDCMRRELEFLQSSVEEAHKKKSFWTMLSSATTVLAAVCIAYIARSH